MQSLLEVLAARDARILELESRVQELVAKNKRILELEEKYLAQVEIIARQAEVISELQRSLGLNSTNSSKPPSSDGLRKPLARSRRHKTGRKPGGQKGHKGHTLQRSEKPAHIEHHFPRSCTHCGLDLDEGMAVPVETRQIHDVPPPPPPVVTDHIVHKCVCPHCNRETRASFPDHVTAPVQYGPNISGLVTYLKEEQHIPVNRVVDVMEQFHGFRMSGGTVVNMVAGKARQFGGLADWIRHLVAFSRVKYMDETGSRIAGRTGWLHVACNEYMTCLWIGKSRGDVMRDARGTIVHDFFPSYQTIPDVRHGYCNVHVLRELEDLVEFAGEGWAGDAAKLLQEGIHLHNEAGGNELPPGIIASLGKRYRRLIGKGLRFHESREPLPSAGTRGRKRKRRGHNLALRLDRHADGVLLYLSDPLVEPTNNYAEQALRPEKLKQKISGCHRSLQGARDTAIIRTVLATARKQGWNALDTLRSTPGELMAKLVTGPMVDTEPIA